MIERSQEEGLRELLARVHERLHHAATVDSETRQLLATLMRDIERALGERDRAGSAAAAPPRGAKERPRPQLGSESLSSLEGLAARFDADHPALAQTLRQLADLLGKVGI